MQHGRRRVKHHEPHVRLAGEDRFTDSTRSGSSVEHPLAGPQYLLDPATQTALGGAARQHDPQAAVEPVGRRDAAVGSGGGRPSVGAVSEVAAAWAATQEHAGRAHGCLGREATAVD
ncbi:MAG: hypothetical protein ACLGI3_06475, partial [Actinomycetes bacterium]